MHCGDFNIRIQDVLGKGIQFDGYKNNSDLNRLLAIRNTQHQEEKVVLSMIRCQATESLPQAGNDQTATI